MEIVLVRGDKKPWGIDGHLYINRERVCDTVEHPKIHLPNGEYTIDIQTYPFRHGDGALGLKKREIIVGKYALPGVVSQSAETYQRLYERLKKAFQRGTSVYLSIRG